MATWSRESCPMSDGMRLFSANSMADPGSLTVASCEPVLAPLGAAALPNPVSA